MIKSDKELLWRPGRAYYPVQGFTGVIGAAGVSVGAHTGAPVQQEITTMGLVGVLLDTAADAVVTDMKIPYDLDVSKNIYARVVWTCGSTDVADTVTWRLLYRAMTPSVTALATPATALDTAIAAQDVPVATAYVMINSPWGVIKGGTISEKAEHWAWLLELNAFDAGLTEDKFALGLEIMYTPKRLQGPDGMPVPAKAPLAMLGKTY
jgi:hypothetical protein